MKTLGIDLASDPAKTGVCVVTWVVGEAVVEKLEVGADDDNVLEVHRRVDVTGIDAPFGWPVPFERMLANETSRWAGPWSAERRDELRFRQTDFMVREFTGRWPLSVSSDLIAVPTMRCVGLLEKMGVTDRSGDGRVFETYPACALQRWGFRSTGYKGAKKRTVREKLWSKLENRMPWLRFSDPKQEQRVVDRDDALDALVSALIARAATKNLTIPPAEEQKERAKTEGWIHVPEPGSFEWLLDG